MEVTCKHVSEYKLLISSQEVNLKHKSANFFTVFSVTVLFRVEEDTFSFDCSWIKDQTSLFELADYWIRIQIHLRCVNRGVHGDGNYDELQDFFCVE